MTEKPVYSGIICEFNPLHLGHRYLLEQAKRDSDGVLCVMSGNWVQRGEPAQISKFARARMAVSCGADLVAELPTPWACAGAERFAMGGVSLLHRLGCVDRLWFGSECGDAESLMKLARLLLSEEFRAALPRFLQTGMGFAAARQRAIAEIAGTETAALLESPNNILGVEYCKALVRLNSPIQPMTTQRIGSGHDCEEEIREGAILSASQLRERIRQNLSLTGLLPEPVAAILEEERRAGRAPADFRQLERAVLAKLRVMGREEMAALPDISEGLENRLYEASRCARSLEDLYERVKSKRYSHARIRRIVTAAFLNLPRESGTIPPYFRILAMNSRGRKILRVASKTAEIPVFSRPAAFFRDNGEAGTLFAQEQQWTDLYALSLPEPPACGWECRQKLCVLP